MRYVAYHSPDPYRDQPDWWDRADVREQTAVELLETRRGTWTGLYDSQGQKLHRIPNRIGFNLKH